MTPKHLNRRGITVRMTGTPALVRRAPDQGGKVNSRGRSRPVLLVGSIPLKSASEVFDSVSIGLGGVVKRIPDGETGPRWNWIAWQGDVFKQVPELEVVSERQLPGFRRPVFGIRKGSSASTIVVGPLGYAEAALGSYREFAARKQANSVPSGTRFQVSLPTPLGVSYAFMDPRDVRAVWPAYERRMIAEVHSITSSIPHNELALQWDVEIEIVRILEAKDRTVGYVNPEFARTFAFEEITEAIARVSRDIPPAVELGIHLCYGDPGHKHAVEPKDTGLMVSVANALSAKIDRRLDWIHMPVPRDRTDAEYFAPLAGLALKPGETLYLGLVHYSDGLEGAKRRLLAAREVVADFGVATECGLGRRPAETLHDLFKLHREVAAL